VLGAVGAAVVIFAVLVLVAGRRAAERQVLDISLAAESRLWPVLGRVGSLLAPGSSAAERGVWSYVISEYERGPRGKAIPLAINPVAEWPTRERETPRELSGRIVDGRPPNEPGNPEAVTAVQDFLLKNARPVRLTDIRLSGKSRFVEFAALARHNEERDGWYRFAGENGGVDGYLSLSRVGFNLFGTRAVVYVELFCGPLCGHGTYYVLERRAGKWQRVNDHLRWIS
jgi:hypothetical protein